MAYTRKMDRRCPLPVEPGVVSVHLVNSVAETNVPVMVPWKNVQLAYAYTVVTEAIDATGAMEIDLELDAAGGTEMMSITVAGSSAVGDIDEATVSSASACKGLSYDETSKDYVVCEIDGSAAAAGSVMLYMFFEPYRGA